jgi:hypothetical protein
MENALFPSDLVALKNVMVSDQELIPYITHLVFECRGLMSVFNTVFLTLLSRDENTALRAYPIPYCLSARNLSNSYVLYRKTHSKFFIILWNIATKAQFYLPWDYLCNYMIIKLLIAEALFHKSEGRGFYTRWGHWIPSIDLILPAAKWPWV